MKGYDRQKRHYSSDICSFTVHKRFSKDAQVSTEIYGLNDDLIDFGTLPYISIIKVSVQYPKQDEPNKRVN